MFDPFLGLPLWLWVLVLLAAVALIAWASSRRGAKRRMADVEALAARADANHEGAQTRHEGGA